MDTSTPFKWRHFEAEIILLCVRWYLRYSLSYRDLEEIMLERGLHIDHTTIYRWVQRYAPELEQRCRPHLKATTDSWRVDETYVKVKGSVDVPLSSSGLPRKHAGVSLQCDRDAQAANGFSKNARGLSRRHSSRDHRRQKRRLSESLQGTESGRGHSRPL